MNVANIRNPILRPDPCHIGARDTVVVHTGITGMSWSDDLEHWQCP